MLRDKQNKIQTNKRVRQAFTQPIDTLLPSAKHLSHGLKPSPFVCYFCYSFITLLIFGFVFFPYNTLTHLGGLIGIFGALTACLKLAATAAPLKKQHCADLCFEDKDPLDVWPRYTVLVPLYKEAAIVETLMENLAAIDYPQDRLEIMMICEAYDKESLWAVRSNLRPPFKLITVPHSKPKTKPKALNYALKMARGDLVTIYDAEDKPHPQQLKLAALRFAADETLGALQAPLDYYNVSTNWLTRQFTLEYAFLFRVWLPFLTRLGLPFPLGGTSNHIRREVLDLTQGWDAYNVTEDADLSFRMAGLGYKIGYIPLPTREEAVENWHAWRYQRARWIKGFLQTWLVHMSRPILPGGLAGLTRFITIQLTIGSALIAGLIHTPFMIYILVVCSLKIYGYEVHSPSIWVWSGIGLCYAAGMISGAIAAIRLGEKQLLAQVVFMPLYWWLLFPATLQAIWEFLFAPFHWNKTEHGLTAMSEDKSIKNAPPNVRGLTS